MCTASYYCNKGVWKRRRLWTTVVWKVDTQGYFCAHCWDSVGFERARSLKRIIAKGDEYSHRKVQSTGSCFCKHGDHGSEKVWELWTIDSTNPGSSEPGDGSYRAMCHLWGIDFKCGVQRKWWFLWEVTFTGIQCRRSGSWSLGVEHYSWKVNFRPDFCLSNVCDDGSRIWWWHKKVDSEFFFCKPCDAYWRSWYVCNDNGTNTQDPLQATHNNSAPKKAAGDDDFFAKVLNHHPKRPGFCKCYHQGSKIECWWFVWESGTGHKVLP